MVVREGRLRKDNRQENYHETLHADSLLVYHRVRIEPAAFRTCCRPAIHHGGSECRSTSRGLAHQRPACQTAGFTDAHSYGGHQTRSTDRERSRDPRDMWNLPNACGPRPLSEWANYARSAIGLLVYLD